MRGRLRRIVAVGCNQLDRGGCGHAKGAARSRAGRGVGTVAEEEATSNRMIESRQLAGMGRVGEVR